MRDAERHLLRRRAACLALAFLASVLLLSLSGPNVRAATPTLRIVSPANNALIGNGSSVPIVFVTSDFNLTEPGTGGAGPNDGHVRVFVDRTLYAVTAEPMVLLPLAPGSHVIRLQLVADNGTGFVPDVNASVTVTSTRGPAGGPPGITIVYPAEGEQRGPDTAVSFWLTNFALVPPGGPASVPNEGHVEVLLDGVLYQELTVYEPAHFSDLPDGVHNVTLRLVDSEHNPLTPDVAASVRFHVRAPGVIDISPAVAITNAVLAGAVIVVLFYPLRKGTP